MDQWSLAPSTATSFNCIQNLLLAGRFKRFVLLKSSTTYHFLFLSIHFKNKYRNHIKVVFGSCLKGSSCAFTFPIALDCLYDLCTGVHIILLVSYWGEYRDMVFGTNPTHSPTWTWILPSFTKEIPFSMHNFSQPCFLRNLFFYKTATAWPRSVWISHSEQHCNQLISPSSPVCTRWTAHTAHMSVRLAFVSSHSTSCLGATFRKKN